MLAHCLCVLLLLLACSTPTTQLDGTGPLHIAIQTGSHDVVQVLLDRGASVNLTLVRAPPFSLLWALHL